MWMARYYRGMDSVDWLLDSDPAIRWQAMRDLTDASPAAIDAERARVAREGIGAEILARQESDGAWRRGDEPVWLSTLFTFLLLRATGIDRGPDHCSSVIGDRAPRGAPPAITEALGCRNGDQCRSPAEAGT